MSDQIDRRQVVRGTSASGMLTHEGLVKKMLRRPAVRAAHAAMADEYALLDALLRARHRLG